MILNCDDYRISFKDVTMLLGMKPLEERFDHIGMVAVVTNVPIIVVCHYFGEVSGYNNQLNDFIAELCIFYKVLEVKNAKG